MPEAQQMKHLLDPVTRVEGMVVTWMSTKSFLGTSENAVKTRVWIAVSVHVLVSIIKSRLGIAQNLHTILQFLSVSSFEKIPLDQLLTNTPARVDISPSRKQLNLFD